MDKLNELQNRLWNNAFTLEMRYGIPYEGKWYCDIFTEDHTLVCSVIEEFIDDLIEEVMIELNKLGYE